MRLFAAAAVAALLAAPAEGATLRPLTTLEGPAVHLADLFDEAGPIGAKAIGPAPQPGARIVVEAAQLAAIARQFGVEWRPGSPNDRAVLERPGRMLPREPVLAAVHAALAGVGASGDLEIDLPGYASPMVPLSGPVETSIEQLDWDGASGRFTALLVLTGDGIGILRLRLAGTATEMIEVPVPVRRLNAGSVVQAEDLHINRVRAGLARGEIVRGFDQAIGQTLRRQAIAGQPLALADLARTASVTKGARVTMQLRGAGLTISAQGLALEPGAMGEHIRILNPSSRAVVEAEVVGTGTVRILPGSSPVQLPANRTAQLINSASIVQ